MMEGQLPDALGKLHAQLERVLEEEQIGEADHARVARLAHDIEDVAAIIQAAAATDIGPTESIKTYSLGAAPTHCEACGQPLESRR